MKKEKKAERKGKKKPRGRERSMHVVTFSGKETEEEKQEIVQGRTKRHKNLEKTKSKTDKREREKETRKTSPALNDSSLSIK
jgi:hypothetical protein